MEIWLLQRHNCEDATRPGRRPPAGDVAKAESETARRAYVAARLEQEANQEYLETLGVGYRTGLH